MRLDLEISTEGASAPSEAFVRKVAEEAIVRGIKNVDISTIFVLEVVFVSEERIQAINQEYRNKDAVTDVLSFGDYADTGLPSPFSSPEPVILGQLFLCYNYIEQAASEDGVSFEREMAYILSHGVLHLLGYDHTDEMFAIQDVISQRY